MAEQGQGLRSQGWWEMCMGRALMLICVWLWGVYECVQMYVRGYACVEVCTNTDEEVCLCNCGMFKCRYGCVGMQVYMEMCVRM